MDKKILIALVAYNAENHIISVLKRIPDSFLNNSDFTVDILVLDDESKDNTHKLATEYASSNKNKNIKVIRNEVNLGYGGNQKKAYNYAIENNYDAVTLLHGDGQYAPEIIEKINLPIMKEEADCVLGSRMVNKKDALKGGMPLYKWLGNIFLTTTQNILLGVRLAEFHTGYRAYSVAALARIPFESASDDFEFDTDILIQIIDNKFKIKEIAVPTFYGDEICNVKVISYGLKVLRSTILSRLQKIGLIKLDKFNY